MNIIIKVFQEYARKGKSSIGWFYGLKLHTVINNLGQIISFKFTPGNVADNNHNLLLELFEDLEGYCVGNKGYISKLFSFFYENKLHLITRPRKPENAYNHMTAALIAYEYLDKKPMVFFPSIKHRQILGAA